MLDGLRLAVGTFTVLRVRIGAVDGPAAGWAMTLAPLIGFAAGALAGAVAWATLRLGAGPMLAAVFAVATLAITSRALHLDGLADTADALGSGRPAEQALQVMRAPDIGPFGVLTLVLVLAAQIAATAQLAASGPVVPGLAVAAGTGRLAATWGCRRSVPAARPDGLGHWVAGSVSRGQLAAATVLTIAGAAVVLAPAARGVVAVAAGLVAAAALSAHCVRRFGGITGDVLGALVETAATVTLVVLTLT